MNESATAPQRVAVIGAGKVGANLARGIARTGRQVTIGARDAGRASDLAAVEQVTVAAPAEAAAAADVVVLAVPVAALADVVPTLGDLDGTILVDATNAVGVPVPAGHDTVASFVASLAPGAKVVKAFNTIGAEHMTDGRVGATPAFLPVAGDEGGRGVVVALATAIGFDAVDLGGPECVGMVEDAARLWIHLAFRCGFGRDFGFGVLRP